eukprot:6525980-Pyramimonas_sp.AAC.1
MAMLQCSVAWRLEVNIGDSVWIPRSVQKVDDDACAMVRPCEHSLCKELLQSGGEACPKSTARPSIGNALGYRAIVAARTAPLIEGAPVRERRPVRQLFRQRSSPKRRPKPKR